MGKANWDGWVRGEGLLVSSPVHWHPFGVAWMSGGVVVQGHWKGGVGVGGSEKSNPEFKRAFQEEISHPPVTILSVIAWRLDDVGVQGSLSKSSIQRNQQHDSTPSLPAQVGKQRQVLLDVGADGGGALGSTEGKEGGSSHEEDEEMVENGARWGSCRAACNMNANAGQESVLLHFYRQA
eukprot:1156865-Pelagomonas_calceolata.AAC.9